MKFLVRKRSTRRSLADQQAKWIKIASIMCFLCIVVDDWESTATPASSAANPCKSLTASTSLTRRSRLAKTLKRRFRRSYGERVPVAPTENTIFEHNEFLDDSSSSISSNRRDSYLSFLLSNGLKSPLAWLKRCLDPHEFLEDEDEDMIDVEPPFAEDAEDMIDYKTPCAGLASYNSSSSSGSRFDHSVLLRYPPAPPFPEFEYPSTSKCTSDTSDTTSIREDVDIDNPTILHSITAPLFPDRVREPLRTPFSLYHFSPSVLLSE